MISYKTKKTVLTAYQIKRSHVNGSTYLPFVYLDKKCADMYAEENDEDFIMLTVEKVNLEELDYDRGIVDNRVVTINRNTAKKDIIKRAISKLTTEEIKALGIDIDNI